MLIKLFVIFYVLIFNQMSFCYGITRYKFFLIIIMHTDMVYIIV